MGCYEVGLGDTLGVGTPKDTQTLLEVLLKELPANKLAGHFHDTYGQAVANVVKAYDMGLRTFDSSVAGLGGCPYAEGARGNLATEDIAYTFEKSGIHTGIDLEKLVSVGDWISRQLGLPNGSRAGSALFAKRESVAKASPTPVSTPSSRSWKNLEYTGEYTVSRASNVVKITLARPRNGNALTNSMVEGLTSLFTNLAHDPSVFHVVLAAEGKFFCTGMDLSGGTETSDVSNESSYYSKVVDLFSAIDNAPQTTIAMINGPCFGGGVGLGFACDIRLVSSRARWTLSEIKLGLSPAIISKYMIREWGIPFLREAMLTGREVTPPELQRIGAVHGISDDTNTLDRMMEEYLDKLSNCAPRSAAACKELIRLGWTDPGGRKQDERIRKTFDEMMAPGSEGKFGIDQFQKKVRGIDWGHFWAGRRARI
jgi:hydroxymethylglutaryl-CoA lyase